MIVRGWCQWTAARVDKGRFTYRMTGVAGGEVVGYCKKRCETHWEDMTRLCDWLVKEFSRNNLTLRFIKGQKTTNCRDYWICCNISGE